MRQGQSPKTQVGSSVGHGTKDELDRMNHRMNEHLTELVRLCRHVHVLELLSKGSVVGGALRHERLDLICRVVVEALKRLSMTNVAVELGIATIVESAVDTRALRVSDTGLTNLVVLSDVRLLSGELGNARSSTEHDRNGNSDHNNQNETDVEGSAQATVLELSPFSFVLVISGARRWRNERGNNHSDDTRHLSILDLSSILRHVRDNYFVSHVNKLGVGGYGCRYVIDVNASHELHDNDDVHPAEQAPENSDTADDVAHDADKVSLLHLVRQLDEDTDRHVEHTDDDGHLHLNGVGEDEGVLGDRPGGILTERISAVAVFSSVDTLVSVDRVFSNCRRIVDIVAGAPHVHLDGEELVVDETTVGGHDTHKK